ncbi:unnamed protein product, partial [Candidula unifasciata]
AYLREGVALHELGRHGDALAAFACGLGQEPGNVQLLDSMVEAALASPLKDKLESTFQQLEKFGLKSKPFIIIAVVGQELLAAGQFSAAVTILEAALKVGTCSLKLRGSVFSALSSALWGLGNLDKAIYHMQQDLAVAKNLGDREGECRAYGNLGSAYFTKGHYKESLANHRFQLVLAMKLKDRSVAASALSSLGHVYTAIGDYPNALASHKQCVLLLKQSRETLLEAREIGNVGSVYLAMGNFENAVECHQEHLKIAKGLKSTTEEARAYSNLGSAYHYKRDYQKAMVFHKEVLKVAELTKDKTLEARAYAGLGHAARCCGDTMTAKTYHEKQLDNALQTKDKVAEGRACSNLGIIFHQLGEYEAALKLHKVHLKIAKALQDRAGQGRAYGNIGNAYSALGKHELAVKQHKQELAISSEVNDRHSEGSTHGNLAVAYQALGKTENALHHYLSHLSISRELKDLSSEARALCNLGNFHCARGNYSSAVSFYEQFLSLSRELNDSEGESKACFNLGYVHFNLGNFSEAVKYYEQDLAFARDRKDRLALARAYCNLGLAHKSLLRFDDALECQRKCLKLMDALENTPGKLRALGNIGDLMMKQQLNLARQCDSSDLLATAYGALGSAHRMLGQYDKSLAYHTQELNIRQDINDLRGECRAHGNVGNVHMSLGNFLTALKCYQEMLERSRELKDHRLEGQACGNLGITKMNMGQYEEAIGLLEEQLAMLEQHYGPTTLQDKGKAFGNLGDCYEALGDYEEAVKWHEQFLIIAQQTNSLTDQDRAYRGLGNSHKAIGNLQQALVCFEKRLYVAHQTNRAASKASAYGELGCLHSLLGNLEQAIACLQHQLSLAEEMGDANCQGDAACGLGGVYQQMGEYSTALTYHQMDLRIAEKTNNTACQCRAYGNLGLSYESLGNLKEAIEHQNQHLSIAAQLNDGVAKTLAYSSLGRVHHALGNYTEAVQYLQQGLQIAEQLRRREDEAKIRHRLGLSLWSAGNLDQCQQQLHRAADLFETIRRESQCSSEYRLSLFDLQTACYQTLQRVLVSLNRHDEALVVAERACTRAFIDLLLERQAGSAGLFNGTTMDLTPVSTEQITNIVANQSSYVLCFSIASKHLYSWLLTPKQGIVKFHSVCLSDLDSDSETVDTRSFISVSGLSLLDQCVGQLRESMGIESHIATSATGHRSSVILSGHEYSDTDSEADDVFQLQLEELGDKLNADTDRTGFLAMVNRSHNLNASSYSLGSILSTGAGSVSSNLLNTLGGSQRSLGLTRGVNSPLSMLYRYLIEPMEAAIAEIKEAESIQNDYGGSSGSTDSTDLVLVLQGDLYLVPFLMLRREQAESFLFEKYTTIIVPSISALQNSQNSDRRGRQGVQSSGALVVGNPRLTPVICQHWHLKEIPGAEFEARILGELLTCRPLIGAEATKAAVLHQIEQVEVIHFAAHISWKLSSIVLSPGEFISSPSQHFPAMDSDDSSSDFDAIGGPALSEYLLTAADILNLKLRAKLVVLNSGYTDDRAGRINTDGVVGLTRSLLSAGAQCVLFSLWPVPDPASKLLMKTLYTALLDGIKVTKALSLAVKTVQTTAQFSHPSNWGGWVLVGADITLSSKAALMGHALEQIVQAHSTCRQTLKVLLHLVEKSLQRIHQGCKNSMFTTQQSIENKVGQVVGWKDLLQAVGFRFEPATDGLPPAVFFPQSDPSERLTQASASLQAFLGLPTASLVAMSKFVTVFEAGEPLILVLREILSKLTAKESAIDVMVDVRLWGVSGCHEFLASLNVGSDNVTLRLSKQAVRRHLQFALQALVSVFEPTNGIICTFLTGSSYFSSQLISRGSLQNVACFMARLKVSLSLADNCTRSIPAEMEKVRNVHRNSLALQSTPSASPQSPRSPLLDPAVQLSHQAHIRSVYGVGHNATDQTSVFSAVRQTEPPDFPGDSSIQESDVGVKVRSRINSCNEFSTDDKDRSAENKLSLVVSSHDGLNPMKERNAENSEAVKTSRKSSLSAVPQQVKNGSLSEEGLQKSVTFAEKLISEEISFDSSSPRCDSGSDYGGCHRHTDLSMIDSRQQTEKEISEKSKCTKTSEIREYFEKLNKQKVQDSLSASQSESSDPQTLSTGCSENISKSQMNLSSDAERQNVAMKILGDVSSHRVAVEFMQKQSLLQSQETNRRIQEEKEAKCQPEVFQIKSPRDIQNPHLRDNTFSESLDISTNPNSLKHNFNRCYSSPHIMNILHQQTTSSQSLLQDSKRSSMSGCVNTPALNINSTISPVASPSKSSLATNPSYSSAQHSLLRKHPIQPHHSAYNALFPQGGLRPPSPHLLVTSPSLGKSLSSPRLTHVGRGGQPGAGSGENSISSDISEGAESNIQSSVSSGYHSEKSGFFGANLQAIPPPNDKQDKGVFTQDFVNRTPSFTYSSGSSSPFSRTSNDDHGSDSSGGLGKTSMFPFTNVYFPNHIPRQKDFVAGNADISKQSQEPCLTARTTDNNNNSHTGRRVPLPGQSMPNGPLPPAPLVRTNALQLRPESSNSLSSQYSTSSSTLSTIHKPYKAADSPRVRDSQSQLANTSYRSSDNSKLCSNTSPQSTLSYCPTVNSNCKNPPHQYQQNGISTATKNSTIYAQPSQTLGSSVHHLTSDNTHATTGHQENELSANHSRTNDSNVIDPEEANYRTQLGNVQSIMFDSKLSSRMIGHKQFDNQTTKIFKSYKPISCQMGNKEISEQTVIKAGSDSGRHAIAGARNTANSNKLQSVQSQPPLQNLREKVPPYYGLHSSKC